MGEIVAFNFEKKDVRVVEYLGEPWFVLADICEALGLTNPTEAARALDDDEKSTLRISEGISGNPNKVIISESGLYVLVIRSNKPEALRFRKWVTMEVLPQIRRTGSYKPENLSRLQILHIAMTAETERIVAEKKLAIAAPKAEAFDAFLGANGSHSIKTVAKELGTGEKRLFIFLRENEVLMTSGSRRNLPYQKYIDNGCFVVKESPFHLGDSNTMYAQTRVLPKGIDFIRLLMKREAA